jgi:hypothetical protein
MTKQKPKKQQTTQAKLKTNKKEKKVKSKQNGKTILYFMSCLYE